MTYYDAEISSSEKFGFQASVKFPTTIIESANRKQIRIGRWASGRREYDIAYDVKQETNLAMASILSFFQSKRGPTDAFKFKDWTDFTTALDHVSTPTGLDQFLGVGDGQSGQTFELVKHYVSGQFVTTRRLCKIVSGSIIVMVDGVDKTANCTFNLLTGVITFASFTPVAGQIISAGCEFRVQVRFADENLSTKIPAYATKNLDSIRLIEESEVIEGFDMSRHSGCTNLVTMNKTFEATLAGPRALNLASLTNPGKLILPDPTTIPLGGPHFYLNNSGAYDISIVARPGLGSVGTLSAGAGLTTTVLAIASGGYDVSAIDTTGAYLGGFSGNNFLMQLGLNSGSHWSAYMSFVDTVPMGAVIVACRLKWRWGNYVVGGTNNPFLARYIAQADPAVFPQSGSGSHPFSSPVSTTSGSFLLPNVGSPGAYAQYDPFTLSGTFLKTLYDEKRLLYGGGSGLHFALKLSRDPAFTPQFYKIETYEDAAALGHPEYAATFEVDWSVGSQMTAFTIEGQTGSTASAVGTPAWRFPK